MKYAFITILIYCSPGLHAQWSNQIIFGVASTTHNSGRLQMETHMGHLHTATGNSDLLYITPGLLQPITLATPSAQKTGGLKNSKSIAPALTTNASIAIYPNPASSSITISTNGMVTIQSKTMYDISGKQVYISSSPSNQISLKNLPPGIYQLHILLSDGSTLLRQILKNG